MQLGQGHKVPCMTLGGRKGESPKLCLAGYEKTNAFLSWGNLSFADSISPLSPRQIDLVRMSVGPYLMERGGMEDACSPRQSFFTLMSSATVLSAQKHTSIGQDASIV